MGSKALFLRNLRGIGEMEPDFKGLKVQLAGLGASAPRPAFSLSERSEALEVWISLIALAGGGKEQAK